MSADRSRFLIVRLGSLGDVVHAIPAVAALKNAHPDAPIDWIVDPRYEGLIRLVTVVDRVIPFDTREPWWGIRRTVRALRRSRYRTAIDLQGLLKSAALTRAAGATRTIGFSRGHLREPLARLFYTEAVDPGDTPHVIHKGLALAIRAGGASGASGAGRASGAGEVRFPLTVPASAAADAVAARVGSSGFALINPGAAWPNKRWPPERFGELSAAIRARRGLRSIVLWGPGEDELAAAVVRASNGAAELAPPTSIPDILAIAKRASLMVSGDTGPLHLAGAVGTPIVALFGPTRAERNGPWAPADISISRVEQCICHYERRCRRDRPCINDIDIDEVVAAVERRVTAR